MMIAVVFDMHYQNYVIAASHCHRDLKIAHSKMFFERCNMHISVSRLHFRIMLVSQAISYEMYILKTSKSFISD